MLVFVSSILSLGFYSVLRFKLTLRDISNSTAVIILIWNHNQLRFNSKVFINTRNTREVFGSTVCVQRVSQPYPTITLIRMTFISIKPGDKESQSAFEPQSAMSREGLIKSNCDYICGMCWERVEIQQESFSICCYVRPTARCH